MSRLPTIAACWHTLVAFPVRRVELEPAARGTVQKYISVVNSPYLRGVWLLINLIPRIWRKASDSNNSWFELALLSHLIIATFSCDSSRKHMHPVMPPRR